MKLIWTLDLDDKVYSPFKHKCMPIVWKGKLFYAFETVDRTKIDKETNRYQRKIVVLEIDINAKATKKREFYLSYKQAEKTLNSNEWQFIIEGNNFILFTGLELNFLESTTTISESDINHKKFKIKSQFNFIDKYITYNHKSKLECFDKMTNKLLWKQSFKGYLYTDITTKSNLIFFGTAGKGGAFYTINSNTGEIVVEFNNGDASEYSWNKENIIIKDKKGNLIKLNPYTGEIINTLRLKEKIHFYSPILVDGNKIFTRVYNTKQKIAKLICIED